jgi:Tfp pilus assembly protein PilF
MNQGFGIERTVAQIRVVSLRLLLRLGLSRPKATESKTDSALQGLRWHFRWGLPVWLVLCGWPLHPAFSHPFAVRIHVRSPLTRPSGTLSPNGGEGVTSSVHFPLAPTGRGARGEGDTPNVFGSDLLVSSTEMPPSSAEDPCQSGLEALDRKEFAAAETRLKDCLKNAPPTVAPYLALCGLYQSQGRTKDLHEVALAGLQRFPQEKRFYLTVGIQAGQEERYERAIEVFSEGFRRWPDDANLRKNLASAHLLLGMKQLDEAKNQEAESHLRKATQLADNDVEAHLNLGRALHNLSRSVEALAEFDRVLALNAQTPLAHFHRGLVLRVW